MSEQTMWAVKSPGGSLIISNLHCSKEDAQNWFARDAWPHAERAGYRAVEVRITEVQDGA